MSTTVALLLIVIAIGVAFRSIAMSLVALLPNAVPIVVGLAIYRLATTSISAVPAVVFCVAVGLAADDTVHLMNRFRELRPDHPDARSALVEALCTVRTAMVTSSLVLIAAFASLGISNFPANRTLGVLGCLVLVLALGSDLLFGTSALAILGRRRDRQAASEGGLGVLLDGELRQ